MKKKEWATAHYRNLLIDFLRRFGESTRQEINEFMLDEIRGTLSIEQKISKIGNILTYLRKKAESATSEAMPNHAGSSLIPLIDFSLIKEKINELSITVRNRNFGRHPGTVAGG